MDSIDTILLDWDGTLIDTAQPSFAAFQKALADLGIAVTHGNYEQIYAPNWYNMYAALRLPRDKWQEADDLWLRHYGEDIPELADGAEHVLDELGRRGYCLGVVTSGSRLRVQREIKTIGLSEAFGVVVCNEDVVNKKPHPEGLEKAMRQMGKQPRACCYVGDSADDVEMGKRAEIRTVGIQSRYPGNRRLKEANPDFLFPSIDRLLQLFENPGSAGVLPAVK